MIGNVSHTGNRTLYIPLQFWFCRNAGLALPLIALQYHEVKINIDFNNELNALGTPIRIATDFTTGGPTNPEGNFASAERVNDIVTVTYDNHPFQVGDKVELLESSHFGAEQTVQTVTQNTFTFTKEGADHSDSGLRGAKITYIENTISSTIENAKLFVDYIYLDTDERRRFAQVSHEYLIEQVQYTKNESLQAGLTEKIELNFNHPVKCLLWTLKNSTRHNDFSFQEHGVCKLQLNGHDRFAPRNGTYFSLVQPYQHMPIVPDVTNPIHMYSFSLKPADHQPSGTCNMSRIDNALLSITSSLSSGDINQTLNVYALNYNVLRIMSGMGGLAFSN